MKLLIVITLLSTLFNLQADEFAFIKPISVETPPVIEAKIKKTTPQEPKIDKAKIEKVAQKTTIETPNKDTQILNIHFKSFAYKISDELISDVREFADYLNTNRGYQAIIYGYTDSSGNKVKNKILSQKRANSVKAALVANGVSSTRLTAIGKGEKEPIADNSTSKGRKKNRRIEILLIK